MEIDGIDIELIKIKQTGEFPLVMGIDSNDEMLISRLGKFNRAKYGEMLTNLNSNSQFLGTITPSSTIPAQGNVWGFAAPGTYPNAGNLTVSPDTIGILTRVGTTWSKVEVDFDDSNYISTSVYKTDFTTIGEWQTDSWEVVNGVARNLQNGITKNFHLPFIYNCNKRRAKFRIKPSADTDFRIHLKANYNTESEGGSLFGLNFGTGKMQIFKVLTTYASPDITSTGVDVNNVLAEKSFNFINGREYCVELKYYKTKHSLSITDMVSAEKTELSFDGWAGGRQQQQYSFWVNSGGQVQILDFELFLVDDVENLFVGDSITEGVMVVDKKQRWWELMTPYLKGITAVSARGGHTTGDVLAKFDNELKLLKPKRIIFLIGINNGGAPSSHFTELLNKCLDNNIQPIFCYHTAFNNGSHLPTLNNMLSVIPPQYLGFRFDLATSTNNDGVNADQSLFYDGLHPIESGCTEMAKRLFADVDILK